MSDNVISIWDEFRAWIYQDCSLLEDCPEEYLSSSLVSIWHSFRQWMFYDSINIKSTANEYLPEGLQTIWNSFRKQQYQWTWITKTAQEVMPKSLVSIGTDGRNNQYYNCLSLKEIVWEYGLWSNVLIGTKYRYVQYSGCTFLSKAKLAAQNWLSDYRNYCFNNDNNLKTIIILWDVLDTPLNAWRINNDSIEKIYVDSSLVSAYQNSSNWSTISDDKFVAIPSISGNIDTLLFNDVQDVLLWRKRIGTQKLILDWTENRVWDSWNNRVTLSVQGTLSLHADAYCTHWPSHPSNSSVKDDWWCTYSWILCCYTTQNSLNDFKTWLSQEYSDWTPVIVLYESNFNIINIAPIDLDTQNWENIIEITQAWPDVNDLQAQIIVEQSTWWYTANVFNGEDYSVESNWIEISEQEEDEWWDVVWPNSSTDWNVALFDWTTWKLIKDSWVNLSDKQDKLTAWNWIDITNNTVSTTYCYWESTTAAATVQKVVSIPSITELNVWQVIIVKPTVTSTVANSTLKLNDFPAYAMIYNGSAITTSTDSIAWAANVPSLFLFDTFNDTYCWRFLGHWLDSNSTYTLNRLIDPSRYKVWTGTYAFSRYSLVMEKADWTREKITNTAAAYSTWTTKTVNTNWFRLWHIRYYNTTSNLANWALVAANAIDIQAPSVTAAYSFNCGTAPWWTIWTPIYLVGSMWADWLFYLDTTQWRATQLPGAKDWKLYIRLWTALSADNSTFSLITEKPIFYHDWIKICDYVNEANEIIYKRPTTWNYTLQSSDWVLSWVAI